MAKQGKRIRDLRVKVDQQRQYEADAACNLVKDTATASFPETVEAAIMLGVDPRKSDQMVRGSVSLPHGTGKEVRVAVFARDAKADEAREAGADIVGADDLLEMIQQGEINFDRCIATPDMMAIVGRVAKVLGPKGLMPNPKLGTVTPNVADAVKAAKAGQIQFRIDKGAIIHAGIGKVGFESQQLKENLAALLEAIEKAKPATTKGAYIKRVSLASSMGPGVPVDIGTLAA